MKVIFEDLGLRVQNLGDFPTKAGSIESGKPYSSERLQGDRLLRKPCEKILGSLFIA